MHRSKLTKETGRTGFLAVTVPLLVLFGLVCFIPFVLIIVASLTDEAYINAYGYSLLPHVIRDGEPSVGISTQGYAYVMENGQSLARAYGVTALVTVCGTALSLAVISMAAYVLHRKDFKYRNFFSFFLFFTTLFSGGLFPTYYLITNLLGWSNNLLALIIPGSFSVWNMLLVKGYLGGIPDSVEEAAKIDGAGDFTIFLRIMMPLCLPVLATVGLFTALFYWNDWYNTMLYISDKDLYMLQYYLYDLINSAEGLRKVASMSGGSDLEIPPIQCTKMAVTLVVIGPIILLYPFVQRYFIKGMTIGAVKG